MQISLIVCIIGEDRTGLVESLSRLITDQGGNWLESRMCSLASKFAGIVRIHVPKEREESLVRSLEEIRSEDMIVIVHRDQAEAHDRPTKTASLTLVGQDRPGIIHQVSAALAHQGVNVEELESECSSAPMSGERIFKAIAKLQIPDSCILSDLRGELEEIGSELMVDISFSET
jgi:glycine cleavage system regulatory protein